jgi:parvulin-like peptidyl-prolyl isomerase
MAANSGAPLQARVNQFSQFARQYSEDAAAQSGGDLGFVEKGKLDPDFEAAAWKLPAGAVSGIVQTQYGYHLIMVEAKQQAGTEPFEQMKGTIHEALLGQKMAEVMSTLARLTSELRANSRIAIYKENIR